MIFKKYEIIIIFIALIILIIYFIIYFDIFHNLKNQKNIKIQYENFTKKLKTGDLLFFSENHFNHKLIKFYTNSYFSHVGIIVKETEDERSDKYFIIEADIGKNYKSGTRIVPLENKLKNHKIVGLLSIKEKIDNNDLLILFDKYQKLKMDNSMLSWVVSDIPFLYKYFKDETKIFCSELIAQILIDLKILYNNKLASYYSPQKLIDNLEKIHKYNKLEIYNFIS